LKKRFKIPEPEVLRSNIAGWFRERIDLGPVLALAAKKTVPVFRHSWIYMLGGAALFLFGLQVASGALLMLYYQPSEATAYESVQKIVAEVPFGRVVRSVHVCGANFFIAVVGLHLLVKLFTRAYRKPREITWISGMLLLFASLGLGFSGYLLPWNELSYFATSAGTAIAGTLPGDWVEHFLRGGQEVTGDTLTRFYAAHVMFLPLVLGLLLAVHLGMIQSQGMSLPPAMDEKKVRDAMPFFSEFLLIELCIWLLLFGTIVTLATLLPAEVGVKADPLQDTPEDIKPEWYFLFMFQTLKHVPEKVGVLLFAVAAAFLLFVPFLDRKAMREEKSPGFTAVFVLLVVYAAVFQIWALLPEICAVVSQIWTWVQGAPAEAASADGNIAASVVSLAFVWGVIGFLVFYLCQLLKENTRIRRMYYTSND